MTGSWRRGGLRIVGAAITSHSARPWRMTAADYRHALEMGESTPLTGSPTASPWDPETRCAADWARPRGCMCPPGSLALKQHPEALASWHRAAHPYLPLRLLSGVPIGPVHRGSWPSWPVGVTAA
ncbi:MAG: DUF2399 domain-containing protein, partial [Streptosporangiaceae bacterium]